MSVCVCLSLSAGLFFRLALVSGAVEFSNLTINVQ